LSSVVVTGFVILASKITAETADAGGAEKTCDALVGMKGQGGTLTKNTDYFQLASIPKGALANDTTVLIAATGCLPKAADGTADTARCGSDWTAGGGNVAAKLFVLDRAIADATKMGAQVAHVASAWDGVIAAAHGGPVTQVTGFATPPPDASALGAPLTPTGINFDELKPMVAASRGVVGENDFFYVRTVGADAGLVAAFALPLHTIVTLTNGSPTGTGPDGGAYFIAGTNYTFVLLGDPTAQQLVADGGLNPNYKGYGLHVIAFPNDFTPPKLQ
jgi:hypothetical protein